MEDQTAAIQIKGLRDGLLVTLSDASWEDQRALILSQIDERPTFFQGAKLAMDIGSQSLKVNELVELRDRLSERGVALWAVVSESPTTEKTAQLLGLATRISKPRPEERLSPSGAGVGEDSALFLNKTLRSGKRIEHAGNIVLMGDVNPGAEIVAEGSIIVWGRVRGLVHAGSKGDRQAVICALDLSTAQIRLAEEALDALPANLSPTPQVAGINGEGKLELNPWQPG